jgi:hypothetical protein
MELNMADISQRYPGNESTVVCVIINWENNASQLVIENERSN